jgi:hypothetical protein
VLSLILLFIFGAIRVDFGRDYPAYENIFNEVKHYSFLSEYYDAHSEIGYLLLNKILPSYRFLIVLLTAFTCITYYYLFKNYIPRKYYWVGFLLMAIFGQMMVFFQFSGLRNAITINIMALSIPFIIKRKIFLFSLLVLLAYFFHTSAVFFMPLAYFIATPTKFRKKELISWSVIFLFLLLFSYSALIDFLASFIENYFGRYNSYIDTVNEATHKSTFILFGFVFVMFIMTLIILYKENLPPADNVIMKLSMLFLLAFLLGALNFRMSQYFAPYFLISATIVLNRVQHPLLKFGYISAVIVYMLYAFFVVYMGIPEFPYKEIHTIFDY